MPPDIAVGLLVAALVALTIGKVCEALDRDETWATFHQTREQRRDRQR